MQDLLMVASQLNSLLQDNGHSCLSLRGTIQVCVDQIMYA